MIKKQYYLRYLAIESTIQKEIIAIDYKNELRSGIRLIPKFYFTNDGLMDKTVYYWNDRPVLQVEEIYTYNLQDVADESVPISKRGISKREKTWRYYFDDGTLDESNDQDTYKIKYKEYDDLQGLSVGQKRRFNIKYTLSNRAGTALVILGVFLGPKDAENSMREISATYGSNFNEYEKYGTENIFDDIETCDIYSWLDTYIPTSQDVNNMVLAGMISESQKNEMEYAFNLYDLESLRGMKIRNYFIEKLKGNLK